MEINNSSDLKFSNISKKLTMKWSKSRIKQNNSLLLEI